MIGWKAATSAGLILWAGGLSLKADDAPPAWLKTVPIHPAGSFPIPAREKADYRGSWLGITSGHISTEIFSGAKKIHFKGQGATSGAARLLFELDARIDSQLDRQSLHPSKTLITENYSDEKRQSWQTFDAGKVVRLRSSEPPQKDDGKEKTVRLPGLFDLPGALLYVRSQPLKIGDKILFLAYATGSPYLATVTVEAAEKIQVPEGSHAALRLDLHLQSINKKLELQRYSKARDLKIWLSDDANRLFLRFRGELLVGSALVELEKVEAISAPHGAVGS